jgi:hypothetical protein
MRDSVASLALRFASAKAAFAASSSPDNALQASPPLTLFYRGAKRTCVANGEHDPRIWSAHYGVSL